MEQPFASHLLQEALQITLPVNHCVAPSLKSRAFVYSPHQGRSFCSQEGQGEGEGGRDSSGGSFNIERKGSFIV